ncbi:MAG: TIGR02301 family protein [Hyphomicrobiales bacterium]|nr:MAG: TIGR02301 family protein [Hyphomicrobiales bacterium]
MRRILFFLLASFYLQIAYAFAQQESTSEIPNPKTEDVSKSSQEPKNPGQAPYDVKLLRLSEVVGSIHYLRALCGAKEGAKWRDQMASIIKAENPKPKRKQRLIARFNRGYRTFNQTYNSCTPSALLAAKRYMKEGVLLSNQITSRYGR